MSLLIPSSAQYLDFPSTPSKEILLKHTTVGLIKSVAQFRNLEISLELYESAGVTLLISHTDITSHIHVGVPLTILDTIKDLIVRAKKITHNGDEGYIYIQPITLKGHWCQSDSDSPASAEKHFSGAVIPVEIEAEWVPANEGYINLGTYGKIKHPSMEPNSDALSKALTKAGHAFSYYRADMFYQYLASFGLNEDAISEIYFSKLGLEIALFLSDNIPVSYLTSAASSHPVPHIILIMNSNTVGLALLRKLQLAVAGDKSVL